MIFLLTLATLSLKLLQALSVTFDANQFLHLPSAASLPLRLSPLINPNLSSSPLNHTLLFPANNGYIFMCSGQAYGFFNNHEISTCLDATEAIAAGRERYTFAMPGTPEYDEDAYPLPWRWMSQEASCYVQIALKAGASSGSNSLYKIREAAQALITHCAVRKGEGGHVRNTGGDNNVAIIVGKYAPKYGSIHCGGNIATTSGCRGFVGGIPVGQRELLFAPEGRPADVELPVTSQSHDRSCILKIWTVNPEGDTTSWYEVWEATTAIFFKCISLGMRGTLRGLGNNHQLHVSLLGP